MLVDEHKFIIIASFWLIEWLFYGIFLLATTSAFLKGYFAYCHGHLVIDMMSSEKRVVR
jgi:hypothetical protein